MKAVSSSDARRLDSKSKQALRIRAVQRVEQGESPEIVAEVFGINRRTIYRWLERYHHGGVEGLHTRPKSGRPSKFSADDLQWLARLLRFENPQQYRFPYALWTREIIRVLLRRERNVRVSDVTVGRILGRLGFSPQRPLRRAWQQSPELVDAWKAKVYPEIRKRAKREKARIYFADESGVRSDYHAGTTWAPIGETPVVTATGSRFSINMISAVSPRGELRFRLVEGTVNGSVFAEFVGQLAQDCPEGEKVFLVVDGHPSHRARVVHRKLEALDGKVELFFLPPYAPQLNPDEQVWGFVKGAIGRGAVKDREDLKRVALGMLRKLQKLPEVIRSFFRHPDCVYASS